jgi:hypothetical protein
VAFIKKCSTINGLFKNSGVNHQCCNFFVKIKKKNLQSIAENKNICTLCQFKTNYQTPR